MKVAIRYYSRGGNTKKPAEALLAHFIRENPGKKS